MGSCCWKVSGSPYPELSSRPDSSPVPWGENRGPGRALGIPGHETRSTEALCWAAGDRLFGAGLGGDISEYDLEKLRVKYSLDGFGGPIWSMAADPSGTELAVGCEDGSVKLFQVLPDKIQFERSLDRQKGRVMSLSWHPSGTRIAVGSIDLLRVFDVKSGHAIQRILVDRRLQGLYSRECIVWSVAFLSNGTIVSSDSVGKVQFWDSEKGTLLETHPEEDSIVVGTSEGAVYQFQLLPVKWGSAESKWVRTKPFQHHTHDVRAVAHSATALISGGLDAQLVIRPLMEKMHGKGYDAALRKFTFPHRRLVSCAKKAGLLLFQFPQHLELWRLGATNSAGKDGDILPVSRAPEHLLQLKSKALADAVRQEPCATGLFSRSPAASRCTALPHGHVCCRAPLGSAEAVYLLAASADGDWLAAAGGDWEINIYSLRQFKPLPDDATPLMNQTTLKQLSEKARRGYAHAFKICKKYQPLLFVDLLEEGSLVVVERPLMDIKIQLPPPVQQKKFGT
ncbi:Cirhin [Chelonia mydas]|uniref:Cirhin n=1 Tax=Chelonia mydas TaxID=8469 RepID=M7B8B7_CHEMY|nr:Cirhin [Chelonia mydas]